MGWGVDYVPWNNDQHFPNRSPRTWSKRKGSDSFGPPISGQPLHPEPSEQEADQPQLPAQHRRRRQGRRPQTTIRLHRPMPEH